MHKEVHQATSGIASLGVTASIIVHSESVSRYDASAYSTIEADLGKSAPKDLLSQQQGEDVNNDITELDSLKDDQPFMVKNDKDEEVHAKPNAETEDTLLEKAQAEAALYKAQPSFPNVEQLIELWVEELEIEILGDLKEIPKKLEEFQYSIAGLTKPVAELKNLKLEVKVRLLALPGQGESFLMTEEDIRKYKEIEQTVKADMAKAEIKKAKEELIDLLGLKVIKNCDVLSRGKGPITLKVYKNDGSDEIIQNFKASDLHLGEWREVIKQTPRSTKRYKTSAQLVDHQVGTVLNEPSLGMILFNSHQKQDFVGIKDFDDLNNEMLYNVQEIFFRLHKGYGTNDPTRTFSTFLVAKVEKRNLNPSKQMRLIEQLNQ
ncbi:hypothetical protein Tco_0155531 [Tanacetum coccineum]